MAETQNARDKEIAENIRIQFEESYTNALPGLQRLEKMQEAYECKLPENWSTYSQIYLPYIRTAVEQALPNIWNYLLPKSGMLSLDPSTPMPFDQISSVQNYYEDLITKKIGLRQEGLLTLKDAMKLNVGYGMVDTEIVTPIEGISNTIFGGGERTEIRRMELGTPREVIRYRYIDWRHILLMPDGTTPQDSSGTFFLDGIREDVFLEMYRVDAESENPVLKGDPNEIIKNVRENKTSMAHFPVWWIMSQYTTSANSLKNIKALNEINRRMGKMKSPVRVPVLKCYFNREHIWLTPDGTIIFHIKDSVQALRNPIIKACPFPDGSNAYPVGDAESGMDAADGANIFKNALIDILTYTLHPTTVINRMATTDDNVGLEPHSRIYVNGKVGDALQYLSGPQLPQGIMGIGQDLEQQIAFANGQPMNLQGQGTAGVMRGGGGAFESLLQTTMARSKLAGAVLQTGWLEEVVKNVILLSQIIGKDDSYIYRDGLSKEFVEKTITAKDMMHSFTATVDLDDKFRSSPSERAMDYALYRDVIKSNPRFDWQAADEWVLGDRDLSKKLKASPETEEAQRKQLQAQAESEQKAKQQQQGGGLSPGEQSMQGGASQAGGRV